MFSVCLKWLILILVLISCTISFGKNTKDKKLLFVIKKISNGQLNLTCLATGDVKLEGLSLTGPENTRDFGKSNDIPLQIIKLNNTLYNIDLPPVLDEHWEDFPIHGPSDKFILHKNEYLWISIIYKSDLRIHSINFENELNLTCSEMDRQWIHIQICANSTHFTLRKGNCSHEDYSQLIHSDEINLTINSIYKLHRYDVSTIKKIDAEISGTNGIDVEKTKFHFFEVHGRSIFLSYYLRCSCNATIKVVDNEGNKLIEAIHLDKNNDQWKRIKIEIPHINGSNSKVEIEITVAPKPNSSELFAIRNILLRSNSTDRSITKLIQPMDLSEYTCESMQSNLRIRSKNTTSISSPEKIFPQSKLCYLGDNCYCSAGSQGEVCDDPCPDEFWGNCTIECDCCNVNNICNKITGACENEATCKGIPQVREIELNSSSTTVTGNVLIEKDILQKRINTIKIEYRITNEKDWVLHKYDENLDDPYINITNLRPNKNYTIRAVLCIAHRCLDEHSFENQTSTMCDSPNSSELILDIHQHNISLTHSNYSTKNGSCPEFLFLEINNKTSSDVIIGLTAFTKYDLRILFQGKVIVEKAIYTKKAQSSSVRHLQFHNNNNSITWMEPINPNGNLGDYIVNILQKRRSILCNTEENYQYNTTNLQKSIETIPFSNYTVSVQASNEEGLGYTNQILFETPPKIEIGIDEIPIHLNINETHFQIEVNGCETIYDSWITYEIIFTCSNCMKSQRISNVNVTYTKKSKYIRKLSTSLEPYTNYTVQTSIFRNKTLKQPVEEKMLTTKPICPPAVRNLEIYSLSNNSISVRWKVPKRPRGVLKEIMYKVQNADVKHIKIANMKRCLLWDDQNYFCETIENINQHSFPIDVVAKNYNTSNCKEKASINKIKLQETESDAPRNLKVKWKNEQMEELELTWNHPNKTNGQLKQFKINLNSLPDNIEKELFIPNESYFYNYSVGNLTACRKYNVSVIPMNQVIGSSAKFNEEIITPPLYPRINQDTKYSLDGQNFSIYIPSIKSINHSSIIMIVSEGDCSFTFDNKKLIAKKQILQYIKEDVINKTFRVDVMNDLKIANLSIYKKYSVTIVVTNECEGISRNSSLCLTEIIAKAATISSSIFLWTGIICFLTILVILIFLVFKYGTIHAYSRLMSKIFRYRFNNNVPRTRQISSNITESIEFKHTVPNENEPLIPKSTTIQRKNFDEYLKSAVKCGEACTLYTDFDNIPLKMHDFSEIAKMNKIKNRYLNILPYEESRVILQSNRYINASFVQGYDNERAYIATQGPKLESIDDFWEMIFDYNVKLIAMLCPLKEDGKVKCDQYWPDYKNKVLNTKNLQIEFDSEKNHDVYIERRFSMKHDEMQTTVIQLQFTAWLDHHIPSSSQFLYEFLEKFHKLHDYSSPAVVHCSAGAGRTGTLILCDYLLRLEKETSNLDFPLVLRTLRKARSQMVQTKEQYHFAHVVIYEFLCVGKNRINCDHCFEETILEIIQSKEIISKQLSLLDDIYFIDVPTFNQNFVRLEYQDMAKNRDNKIIPTSSGVIYLQASKRATSTYINAVTVDGYNQLEKFIVTQQPLISSNGSTLADYWRLVIQTKPDVIVSLQSQIVNFYPTENTLLIENYITLTYIKQYQNDISTIFRVKIKMDNEEHTIDIIQANSKLEPTEEGLIDFINFYNNFRTNSSNKAFKVLVTCLNGSDLSGVFVALDYVIEKMLKQKICDVFLAVRTVRENRPSFITSEQQYRFLYRCALEMNKCLL